MKLAEALVERSDANKKLGELRSRISENLREVAEEPVAEDAAALLAAAHGLAERLEWLIRSINATNYSTPFKGHGIDGTLTDALARRDMLATKHKTLVGPLEHTGGRRTYFDERTPGRLVVPVSAWRSQADALAAELRQLDLAVQALNWQVDLIEAG